MNKRIFFSLALCVSPCTASSQMTICNGDVCTVEKDGVERTLSTEEVGKIKRANARTAIGNIDCKHATDTAKCEDMLSTIFSLFPL